MKTTKKTENTIVQVGFVVGFMTRFAEPTEKLIPMNVNYSKLLVIVVTRIFIMKDHVDDVQFATSPPI